MTLHPVTRTRPHPPTHPMEVVNLTGDPGYVFHAVERYHQSGRLLDREPHLDRPGGAVSLRVYLTPPAPQRTWDQGSVTAVGFLATAVTVLLVVPLALTHLVVILGAALAVLAGLALAVVLLLGATRACPGLHCPGCGSH